MSSLKSLFFLAVLAAAACGVYVSLNRTSETSIPPGVLDGSDKPAAPKVEMPPTDRPPLNTAFAGDSRTSSGPGFPGAPASPVAPTSLGGMSLGSTATAFAPSSPAPGSAVETPPLPTPPGDPATAPRANLDTRSDMLGPYSAGGLPARAPAASVQDAGSSGDLDSLMKTVTSEMAQGQVAEAHLLLSKLYGDPRVPPELAGQITRMLDELAATVIYSRRHLLEPAYRVKPGDTLDQIAREYIVPPQLLAKINGIRDPQNLTPGRELKVVRGPFSALVDLGKRELTLTVGGRYAGRFPLDVGKAVILPGTYMVRDKGDHRPTSNFPGKSGNFEIALEGPCPIFISDARGAALPPLGLGDRDLEDVFGILSVGSRVVIQR